MTEADVSAYDQVIWSCKLSDSKRLETVGPASHRKNPTDGHGRCVDNVV